MIVNTHNMFLSSDKRTSGTTSNFQTALFKPIVLSSPNNWFSVRVGSVEIPYVFKLINPSNSLINFSLFRNGNTYNSSVTLEDGNYNILTLLAQFKSKLVAQIQALTGWDSATVLSFTYDRTKGAASFTMLGTDMVTTSLTIDNNSPVFLKCVGFSAPFTFGYTNPSTRTTATSTQNVNVSQNTAVYVRSDSFTQTANLENIVIDNEVSNIIAKIQVNAAPQSYILWTNPTDLEVKISNRIIDTVSLYVGSSTAYQIDLGNLDWSIRLTIHEWSDGKDDYALNMTPATLPPEGLQNLLETREKALEKLKKIRSKISQPIINDTATETGSERQDRDRGDESQAS